MGWFNLVMRVPFNDLAKFGEITEIPDHATPMNAWTTANNITFRDGLVQKANGYVPISSGDDGANPLLCRPQYLMPYYDPDSVKLYWIYPGVNDSGKGLICTFDGTNNVDRTDTVGYPSTGFYGDTVRWNGAVVNGLAVVNNQIKTPQMWGRSVGVLKDDFEDLTNWPLNHTAAVIRGFRNFFLALDVSDTGSNPDRNPYEVMHSGIVDPYTAPEWTPATTNRAGSKYIGEGGGALVDCLPMRSVNIIYSENEAWPMTYVGGNEVFSIGEKALLEYGILAQGCVAAFGAGHHFLVTLGDIVVHDGSSAESIINSRKRDAVFQDIDSTNYVNSFVVSHYSEQEIWFCYPKTGATYPNAVAKWSIKSGAWSFSDLPIETSMIRFGAVPESTSTDGLWSSFSSTTWESATWAWSTGNYSPTQRNLMMAETAGTIAASALARMDSGNQEDGSNMVATLQKTGITVAGMGQNGPILDPNVDKFIDEVWPKIQGGPVDVRVGTAQFIEGPYTWTAKQSFDPSNDRKLDFRVNEGYYGAIEFSSTGNVAWKLDSFEMNVKATGSRG